MSRTFSHIGTRLTCRSDDVAVDAAKVVQLESSGQRQVGHHLDWTVLVPAVDQVVHGPAVCKNKLKSIHGTG